MASDCEDDHHWQLIRSHQKKSSHYLQNDKPEQKYCSEMSDFTPGLGTDLNQGFQSFRTPETESLAAKLLKLFG